MSEAINLMMGRFLRDFLLKGEMCVFPLLLCPEMSENEPHLMCVCLLRVKF